jgi:putative toxin-antitoxin system antitoxin component (TIGR02293 family)
MGESVAQGAFIVTTVRAATLRDTLGLKDVPANGQAWHALLQEGLPYRSLGTLAKALQMKDAALAELLGLTGRTLAARKKAKRFQAAESDVIYALARAFVRLTSFKGAAGAVAWLLNPVDLLKGMRPVDYVQSRIGTEYVTAAIEKERPLPRFAENKLVLDEVPAEDEEEVASPFA